MLNAINEITRHEKETGVEFSDREDFKQRFMKSSDLDDIQKNMHKFAFTMTKIPKIGINPKTPYNTPAGVYAYILEKQYFSKLINNTLPFASESKYCSVLEINRNEKWLVIGQNETESIASDQDLQLVIDRVGPEIHKLAQDQGRHWKFNNDSKIFNLTFFAAQKTRRPTFGWTAILRSLGYVGIYDPGLGVIHPSEPEQIVFLSPKGYTVKKTYETHSLRKEEKTGKINKDAHNIKYFNSAFIFKKEEDVISFIRSLNKDNLDINNYKWNDNKRDAIINLFYQILSGKSRIKPELMTERVLLECFKKIMRLIKSVDNERHKIKIFFQSFELLAKNKYMTDKLNKNLLKILFNINIFIDDKYGLIDREHILAVLIQNNKSLTLETINIVKKFIAKKYSYFLREYDCFIFKNKNLSEEIIKQILDNNEFFKTILHDKFPRDFYYTLAENKNTPVEVLQILYKKYKDNEKMIFSLIKNENIPKDIYDEIVKETIEKITNNRISYSIVENVFPYLSHEIMLAIFKKFFKKITDDMKLDDVLRLANLSPEIIHFLVKKALMTEYISDFEPSACYYLMMNKNCSLKTLRYIKANSKEFKEKAEKIIYERIKDKFGINEDYNFMGFGERKD